jgi:chorismate dehydratase
MTLRIGHIDYLNCVPFFSYLRADDADERIVTGTPAHLNALLAKGDIDLCPASSFEYGRNWSDYLLLPDLSISACGAVQSVLLFSSCPLAELVDRPIAVTGESATSVHLLQILLREVCGFDHLHLQRLDRPVEEVIAAGGAGLLIGDRALRAAKAGLAPYTFDLGALWHTFSGLPFVFALWIVRRDAVAVKAGEVAHLQQRLQAGLNRAMADLPDLAEKTAGRSCLTPNELLAYWQAMSYGLTDAHQQGLKLFFQLAVKHRFLDSLPELHFFTPSFSVLATNRTVRFCSK